MFFVLELFQWTNPQYIPSHPNQWTPTNESAIAAKALKSQIYKFHVFVKSGRKKRKICIKQNHHNSLVNWQVTQNKSYSSLIVLCCVLYKHEAKIEFCIKWGFAVNLCEKKISVLKFSQLSNRVTRLNDGDFGWVQKVIMSPSSYIAFSAFQVKIHISGNWTWILSS